MNENRAGNGMLTFLAGAAAGIVAGMLLAPARGAETRAAVGRFARRSARRMRNGAVVARGIVEEQSGRLAHAFREGREAYQKGASKEQPQGRLSAGGA